MGNKINRTKFQWLWQPDDKLQLIEEEMKFIAYPPNISKAIESAYLNNKNEVIINRQYKINLKSQMQINLNDASSRRSIIRRELGLPNRTRTRTRNNRRLQCSAAAVHTFNVDNGFRGCDFIVDWYKKTTNGTLNLTNSKIVNLTIDGILAEAKLYPDDEKIRKDTDRFINELRKIQHVKELALIQEVCVRFYTEDSFFYRIINETLRNNDRTKFHTLGPFCYLLYNYAGSSKNKKGKLPAKITLYRGEPLSTEVIENYKSAVGKNVVWRWTQFVSTSKLRVVAERFSDGNSLYIIEMKQHAASEQGVCIESLSEFAVEEEVLLRPGIRFKIIKIEEEEGSNRNLFYIDILPSYMSHLN